MFGNQYERQSARATLLANVLGSSSFAKLTTPVSVLMAELLCQECSQVLRDLTRARIQKSIRINYFFTVDRHAELPKPAFYYRYLNIAIVLELSCHPGSNHFLDRSQRAVMDFYVLHKDVTFQPFL
jgi:hypothetical protein